MAADAWWVAQGRELAELLRTEKRLEQELEELYARRLELVEQLMKAWGNEQEEVGDRLSLLRVPAWTSERMEQTVQPGHGGETYPLASLEVCPGAEYCAYAEGGAHAAPEHLHVRDRGVINIVG